MMRIAQVNLELPPSGLGADAIIVAWPTLALVAGAVCQAGGCVSVVQSAGFDAHWRNGGVDYRCVAERRWISPAIGGRSVCWARPDAVVQAVRQCRPDIIHVHGLDWFRHTRALCSLGVPVVIQDHASHPGRRWRRWLRRWAMERAAGIVFTDVAQAVPLIAAGDLSADLPVWGVPESTSAFVCGSQAAARVETGVHGDPAVIWVGRLTHNKDPLTLLDAIERALVRLPDLRLWCCYGDAPLLPEVRARIARSATLRERVHLLGEQPHSRIEMLLRAADIFVSCSHDEGSGYALIEALACGTTPVASAIPAFRRLTANGAVGRLVAPGDAAGYAAALITVAAQDRAMLRTRARAHFDAHLDAASLGRGLMAAYAQALARAAR